MSNQSPRSMSQAVSNIQNSLYSVIEISKRHQWQITNYVVLVYVAIFGLSKSWGNPTPTERAGLSLLALLAGVYVVVLLILIHGDLERYREQLEQIYGHWLTKPEREQVILSPPYRNPALRGVSFLVALIGVVTIGFGLLTYSLIEH